MNHMAAQNKEKQQAKPAEILFGQDEPEHAQEDEGRQNQDNFCHDLLHQMICLVQKGNDGRNRSVDQEKHIAEQGRRGTEALLLPTYRFQESGGQTAGRVSGRFRVRG